MVTVLDWLEHFSEVLLQMVTSEAGIFLLSIPGCQCGYTAHV
jgi:hypothetical protein